jgi:hypothetical protein
MRDHQAALDDWQALGGARTMWDPQETRKQLAASERVGRAAGAKMEWESLLIETLLRLHPEV